MFVYTHTHTHTHTHYSKVLNPTQKEESLLKIFIAATLPLIKLEKLIQITAFISVQVIGVQQI